MGTLYYLTKNDPWEVFALNKVYGAYRVWEKLEDKTLEAVFGTRETLAAQLRKALIEDGFASEDSPWLDRVAERAFAWAKGSPVTFRSEYDWDVYDNLGPYKAITGSAHDSDYEDDGVTYKPGSAW